MEIELNGAKLRVYEDGKIERFGLKQWLVKEETWYELKGSVNNNNEYKQHRTSINKKYYITSRVIYFAFNLDWDINNINPNNSIDHIDRNSLNNHISNLRVATAKEQTINREFKKTKGYVWDKDKHKWRSHIRINKKQKHLGYFDTEEEAITAYQNAKSTHISYII